MARYLADLLGDWMGWSSGTNTTGVRPGETQTPGNGYQTRVAQGRTADDRTGPIDLLSPSSPMRSNTALADAYAAPVQGRSSQQQYGSVAPPNPDIIRRSQLASLGAPLQAREPPPGGPIVAPGIPAPRRLPSAGQPMQHGGGGRQPQSGAMTPAGVQPNFLGRAGAAVGDLLGGIRDWGNAPMYDPSKPTSRWDAIAMTLGNVGAGLSQTGRIGTGLRMGNQGLMQLRQSEQQRAGDEEERQYRRVEMDLKRRALEQKVAPQPHVLGAGGMLVGPNGEVLARAPTAQKDATTAEAALLDPDTPPEIRARAEALIAAKAEPTARDRAYIDHLNATGQHQKAMEEIARIKANRPPGTGTPPAPTLLEKAQQYRDSTPPGSPERALADQYLQRVAASGGSGGAVAPLPPPGYAEATTAMRTKAGEALGDAQTVYKKAKAIEDFEGLDDLMTTGSSWWSAAEAKQERTGLPMTAAQTAHLGKAKALAAAIGEMSSAIRGERFGMSLTPQEKESAESYLPTEDDSVTTLRAKAKGIKNLARTVMERQRDVYTKGVSLEIPPEEQAEAPPPVATAETPPPSAANATRVGQPATDQERASLPIARTKQDAESMPPGQPFILPSGRIGMR